MPDTAHTPPSPSRINIRRVLGTNPLSRREKCWEQLVAHCPLRRCLGEHRRWSQNGHSKSAILMTDVLIAYLYRNASLRRKQQKVILPIGLGEIIG